MLQIYKKFLKTFSSAARDESGIAATEFALLAPVLILLVVITYDIGMVVHDRMSMEDAALVTARYVYQGGDITAIDTEVTPLLTLTDPASYTVTADYTCECDASAVVDCDTGTCSGTGSGYMRKFVNVDTSMSHVYIFPYPGLSSSVTVEGSARLQVE